jgi:hypothetical protein
MGHNRALALIDDINQTPLWQRKPKAGLLGKRLNLTYAKRKELDIRTIQCSDISPRAVKLLLKRARRERARERRQLRGAISRAAYLAASKSQNKPWIVAGMSRRTYYRRLKQLSGTSPYPINLSKTGYTPVPPEQAATPKRKGLSEQPATNQVRVITSNIQKAERLQMAALRLSKVRTCATANELKAPTCLATAEQNGAVPPTWLFQLSPDIAALAVLSYFYAAAKVEKAA